MAKMVRPDIYQMVAVLSTKVKEPNDSDQKKFLRMIKYLNGTKKNSLL